jgi:putative transposase
MSPGGLGRLGADSANRPQVGNLPQKRSQKFEKVFRTCVLLRVAEFHRRRLPHCYLIGQPVFLTWRLYGSLPVYRSFPDGVSSEQAFVAMDRILARAQCGPLFLRIPEIASVVMSALRYRDTELQQYRLHAWVIMANHIHLLVTPLVAISKLMHSLKRFTAQEANEILDRRGEPFWQDESYDRLVRDHGEFQKVTRYIETNPVNAGLVSKPEEFPWSSARKR